MFSKCHCLFCKVCICYNNTHTCFECLHGMNSFFYGIYINQLVRPFNFDYIGIIFFSYYKICTIISRFVY